VKHPTATKIFVENLSLDAQIGIYPHEYGRSQCITLEVELDATDVSQAAASEELNDTLNYEIIAETAQNVVAQRHFPLVETLVTEIADALLALPQARSARVRLAKQGCLEDAEAAGVEVVRRADDLTDTLVAIDRNDLEECETIVIIGGGVAGMSAALWCDHLGHRSLLIDPTSCLGGQLHLVHRPMRDIPAMAPVNGHVLAKRLRKQFASYGGRWLCNHVEDFRIDDNHCHLAIEADGADEAEHSIQLRCKAMIIASGLRRRELGVSGENAFLGRGILTTGTRDLEKLYGHHTAVVGGGDAACENALLLAEAGQRVTLIHRGTTLSARRQFSEALNNNSQISIRCQTTVREFVGTDRLTALALDTPEGHISFAVDNALVRIGWQPNNEWLPKHWLNPRGLLCCSENGTIVGEEFVFAAGDIVSGACWSVAHAMGSGSRAAAAACAHIEK
jgi:thioredoxin reductase (NADPH)